MPALLISTNEDGTVTVAPTTPDPAALQAGEQFPDIASAIQAVQTVLDPQSTEEAGEGEDPAADPMAAAPQEPAAPTPGMTEAGAMNRGYNRAKKGL